MGRRRNLTDVQRYRIGERIRERLAAEAKERQVAAGVHGKEGGRGRKKNPSAHVSGRVLPGETNEKIASADNRATLATTTLLRQPLPK